MAGKVEPKNKYSDNEIAEIAREHTIRAMKAKADIWVTSAFLAFLIAMVALGAFLYFVGWVIHTIISTF